MGIYRAEAQLLLFMSLFASGNAAANGVGNFWCDACLSVAVLSLPLNAVVQRYRQPSRFFFSFRKVQNCPLEMLACLLFAVL